MAHDQDILARHRGFSPVMIGRRCELDHLRALVDDAHRSRRPAVALLTGEAGIGKTRLLSELAASVRPHATVLTGQARKSTADSAFSVVRDAVAGLVEPWVEVPAELAPFEQPLRQLLGPTAGWATKAPVRFSPPEDLSRIAVRLLGYLVGGDPALLVFEDLHWADPESVDLFDRVATDGPSALVVATVRPEDLDRRNPTTTVLHSLRRRGPLTHIALSRLDRDELRQLVERICDTPVSGAVTDVLYDRTQGNPFFVEELVAGVLAETGSYQQISPLAPESLVDAVLPWNTTDAVLARLEPLDDVARDLIRVAAVLGHQCSVDALEAVVGGDRADLRRAMRDLVDRGALVEDAPDVLAFRHALTREAVLDHLLAWERRELHRRAFTTLQASACVTAATLTRHAAGMGDAEAAARHALEAASLALEQGAPRQAASLARVGLEHAPEDTQLHAVAARATERLGELATAIEHAGRWAAGCLASHDLEELVASHVLLAWLTWSQGHPSAAWEHLAAAEQAAEQAGDEALLAQTSSLRAQLSMLAGQTTEAMTWAERSLAAARQLSDSRLAAHALATKGAALTDAAADDEPARLDEARRVLLEARDEARAAGDAFTLARALNNLLMPGSGLVDHEQMLELLDEAREVADRYGLERFGTKVAALAVHAAIVEGDLVRAQAALQEPLLGRAAPMDAALVASLEVHVSIEMGDIDRARSVVGRHRRARVPDGSHESAILFAAAEAELAGATGDLELAEVALGRAGTAVSMVSSGASADWWLIGLFALRAGVDARRLDEIARRDAPVPVRRHAGAQAHFRGALLAAQGQTVEALEALEQAVLQPQAGRPRALVAAARLELAELLLSVGDRSRARAEAACAADDLVRWPGPRQAAVAQFRRRVGDGPPQPQDLLTRRERDIVKLLARGYSNGEIAKELVISPKTAASHVSRILAKTALRRRGQVAAWAFEHGLVDGSRQRVDNM